MDMSEERGPLAKELTSRWWALVLRAVAAIAFGFLALVWPGITLSVLLVLFGVFAFVDGILALVAAFSPVTAEQRRWVLVLIGLVGLAAGILTFARPGATLVALLAVVGAWAIIIGALHIAEAISSRAAAGDRWLWGLSGALSVLFGILIFAHPFTGLLAVVWLIGFFAIAFGFTELTLAMRLRSFGQEFRGALQH